MSRIVLSINVSLLVFCCLLTGPYADFARGAEREQPYSIAITGNRSMTEKELLKAAEVELRAFEQKGYRKADIDDAAFRMRSAYLKAGFAFAAVDYTFAKKEEFIDIIFNIQEGPQVIIEKLMLQGPRKIPEEKLLEFFRDNGSRPVRQQTVFVESSIREGINRSRELYRREGFIDASISGPELNFNESRDRVTVIIPIDEGPQYLISEVRLAGEVVPELADELEKIKKELLGNPYFVRQKLILRTSLEDAYDSIGYANADIDIEAEQQDVSGKIILSAAIKSGVRVRIADITITGNESTRDSFIRDRIQLKPGDIYSRTKRNESFRKLYDSGLFAEITISLARDHDDPTRGVLEVEVQELPNREYYVEPGWGSYEQLRLRAGILEKNLFGRGADARMDGLVSTKGETVTLSYTDPWLLQTDITMNIPLYYERREEPSYTSNETGLSILLSKNFSPNLTLVAGYKYKQTQLFDLNSNQPLLKEEDDYNQGSISLQAVWDTRDDIFFPSRGIRAAGGIDLALPQFGSDLEFGRLTLGCRYFISLPGEYILGLRGATGLVIPINSQINIPISERFFNGGDNTVRSYKHSRLGLKDGNNEPLGGLGYNVFSIELRKRLYRNFAATLYLDAGNVSPNNSFLERGLIPYSDQSEIIDDTLSDFFREFKFGLGIGIQYLLPVGPLRFDFAYNPDPEDKWNEDSWVFHFSLGMAF